MPSSAEFLSNATKGLNYVKSKMVYGSDNKLRDRLSSLNVSRPAVLLVRKKEEELLNAQGIPALSAGSTDWPRHGFQIIKTLDLVGTIAGAGNCQEQAAMAFMYFHRKGIAPLDYMMIPGQHAFCVIGAPVKPAIDNFIEWSTGTATVCDPWEERAEFAFHLARRCPAFLKKMHSYYRIDS